MAAILSPDKRFGWVMKTGDFTFDRKSMNAMAVLRQPFSVSSRMRNVRKRTAVTILLGPSFLGGCNTHPVVVVHDQWAVKQAQADCASRQAEGVPRCVGDPVLAIRDFEAQVSQAFQIDAGCKGMTLVTLNTSGVSQIRARKTWWLFLELSRSNRPNEVRYTVSRNDDPHSAGVATGHGEPNSVVQQFCKFVREGGTVE